MINQKVKIGPFEGTIVREIDTPSEKIVIGYILSVKIDHCPTFYYMKVGHLYNLSRYRIDATIFPSRNEAWCWLMKLRLNVGKEMAKMIDMSEVSPVEESHEIQIS